MENVVLDQGVRRGYRLYAIVNRSRRTCQIKITMLYGTMNALKYLNVRAFWMNAGNSIHVAANAIEYQCSFAD